MLKNEVAHLCLLIVEGASAVPRAICGRGTSLARLACMPAISSAWPSCRYWRHFKNPFGFNLCEYHSTHGTKWITGKLIIMTGMSAAGGCTTVPHCQVL